MANYNAVALENVSVRITDLGNVYVKCRYKTCNSYIILKRRKKITSKITKTQWKRLFSLEPNGCSASQQSSNFIWTPNTKHCVEKHL